VTRETRSLGDVNEAIADVEAGRHDPFAGCRPDWNLTTSAEP
jgi:hypothetical protein